MTLLAILIMTAAPSGTAEEALTRAQRSYERFKYQDGLAALSRVLVDPELTAAQRARVFMLIGVGRYSLADQRGATDAFREALALSPSLTLPPLTSPKIAALFEQLRPVVAPSPSPSSPLQAKLEPVPAPPVVTLTADVEQLSPEPAMQVTGPRPFVHRAVPGLVVTAVGLLAGAVGVGFGIAAEETATSAHRARFGSEVDSLNSRAATWATTANVLFAVAGGVGGTGVVLTFALP